MTQHMPAHLAWLNPPACNTAAALPRPEYPRPQFARQDWLCLNGPWQFEIDQGESGAARGLKDRPLTGTITVPFCPESELSGVGERDFLRCVWYRREVDVPPEWSGRRVLLHFQAADYDTVVWADGEEVARHRGGASGFECDLGDVGGRTVAIVVRCQDDHRGPAPRGKQSDDLHPSGAMYPRTTGIWQSVWMEPVAAVSFKRPRITPDVGNGLIRLTLPLDAGGPGPHRANLRIRATLDDVVREVAVSDFAPMLDLPLDQPRPWTIEDPHLYGVTLELLDGDEAIDTIHTYAGLRSITADGRAMQINGKAVFQRLVLDQGYYPDGIMTAPNDAALVRDIELSKAAGFNGARLHQKVFEERFLYHADRLGYLCWGEFPDWGAKTEDSSEWTLPGATYITQWLECVARDFSHPCIVGWCCMNEQGNERLDRFTQFDDVVRGMVLAAKGLDPTRPVLDASGWAHRVRESDVYDGHDYVQDPAIFKEKHDKLMAGEAFNCNRGSWGKPGEVLSIEWRGQPYFLGEFGGIWWNPDARPGDESWGYGDRVTDLDGFFARFEGLVSPLLQNKAMFGYCYTQLTDVYGEQNGIYRFDRTPKYDVERVRAIQQKPAAIEG